MNASDLPVYTQRQRILEALRDTQVIVVESPTGSGKTTQLPIILHQAGYAESAIIGVTQPRRIAAVGVCRYIAGQLKSDIGGYVGYKMRFEDKTSAETRIKILTDGTLLQEMKTDPFLLRYSVLMIDEAHERTLNIDFILGLIKDILPDRPDLKIIISSATLNTRVFSQYLDNCPIVKIDTPVHPVTEKYKPLPVANDEEVLVSVIVQIVKENLKQNDGDILIFCPGQFLIVETVKALMTCSIGQDLHILPLYGRLTNEEQERVFDPAPPGKTKVVVATNVAETSITIDGITAVIDTGMSKLNFYSPRTFTSTLTPTDISRASADQRKGRAGRTRPGVCYRLYSKDNYNSRPAYTREEIYRTDLAEVVLRMAEIGISDFESFPFISPPSFNGIQGAIDKLRMLDALDKENKLTEIGRQMVIYPLMPRHARMIVESLMKYPDVVKETIIATSFLSTNPPYVLPPGEEIAARKAHHRFRSSQYGDFASYINLYWDYVECTDKEAFARLHYLDQKILDEILAISDQLEDITTQAGGQVKMGGSSEDFLKACARGLLPFVCVRDRKFGYRSVAADRIIIHPGSVLFREKPDFIVAGEIVRTSQTYARSVSPLQKNWLPQIHPDLNRMLFDAYRTHSISRTGGSPKDSTQNIWIAGESFPIDHSRKGKKRAIIEWNKLHDALLSQGKNLPDYGTMRASLILKDDIILADSKVNTIIKIALFLNPREDLTDHVPTRNYNVSIRKDEKALLDDLHCILDIVQIQKNKHKTFTGFAALHSDQKQQYWFKTVRGFHQALSTSLESLETLADDISEELSEDVKQSSIGIIYRRLESLFY